VIKENSQTYVLKNLATGNRIKADGIEISHFAPKKLWFKEVTEPFKES
jgi:hypothetical protein